MAAELDRTLQELEGDDWGELVFSSYVVTACHRLRRKPLGELTAEEIRLALGQKMGVRFLLPVAIGQLQLDPLASGDMYEGALLKNTLTAAVISNLNEQRVQELDAIVMRFEEAASHFDEVWKAECQPHLMEAITRYKRHRSHSDQ